VASDHKAQSVCDETNNACRIKTAWEFSSKDFTDGPNTQT